MALVLLASRPDLTVMSAPENAGVDLIVSIHRKKVQSFNHFGVILKGTSEEIHTVRAAGKALSSLISRQVANASFSMPITVFFFSMVSDHGFHAWLQEPETNDGVPRLRHHAALECRRLDHASLQEIVDAVNTYFDALSKVLAY